LQADKIPLIPSRPQGHCCELKTTSWDLILFGHGDRRLQSSGRPVVAELLGLPCVTALHLDIEGTKGVAEREIEGGIEVVDFPLPAVLTLTKASMSRAYCTQASWRRKKKPLEVKPVQVERRSRGRALTRLPSGKKGRSW